ncbi:MAG: hypothetical protein QMC23_02090 [Rubritalea sp.]
MNDSLKKMLALCTAFAVSHSLVSCSFLSLGNSSGSDYSPALRINTIDKSALTYRAKYGIDYEIHGNVIAKFPHFDLVLFSQKRLPNDKGSIHTYELTSKDGLAKMQISCDPSHPEKKHFLLEDLHFYYHSNDQGSINIYMPKQLLALVNITHSGI